MACIVYLMRVPRYNNLNYDDICRIQSFWSWRQEVRNKTQYAAATFEKWCGLSEKDLPSRDALLYYRQFFERPKIVSDDINGYKCGGIFEQVARLPKASQFLNWVMHNVIGTSEIPYEGTYEISKEQLEQLLEACNHARRYAIRCENTEIDSDGCWRSEYKVNAEVAKAILPILEKEGNMYFPYDYESTYGEQVVTAIKVINDILASTNFEKQAIYFRYG